MPIFKELHQSVLALQMKSPGKDFHGSIAALVPYCWRIRPLIKHNMVLERNIVHKELLEGEVLSKALEVEICILQSEYIQRFGVG